MQLTKTIFYTCLLTVFSCFSGSVFAVNNPIPGINIVVKRNPPPRAAVINTRSTDDEGKMSLRLESGRYDLSISYDQVMAVIARIDKNKAANNGCYKIQLTLDPDTLPGVMLNGDTLPKSIELTKSTSTLPLLVPAKGTTIRFTLTWDSCRWGEKK